MNEILKGFAFGLGFFICFFMVCFFILILLKKLSAKKQKTYDTRKLLVSFKRYRAKLEEDEDYDMIAEVIRIMDALEIGKIIDEVHTYNIRRKSDIAMKDEDGSSIFQIVERYIIEGKK